MASTAQLPTQSSGIDLKGIASLADLFTGKNSSTNTNTSGTSNSNTNSSTNTGSTTNGTTNGNTNGVASTQNAGGVRTTGTTTTSDNVTPEAVTAVVNSILQGSAGIAAIASGQARAGLYNSSTNNLLINDLVARAAAEGAKLSKSTTVTQDTTAADNRTTTSTQNQNTAQTNTQNQDTKQSTQQATSAATTQQQGSTTIIQPQIKPSTAIGAIGGLTALGQLAQTEAGKALLKKLGLANLLGTAGKAASAAKAAPGGANDTSSSSSSSSGSQTSSSPINPNASVAADGTPVTGAPIVSSAGIDSNPTSNTASDFSSPITRLPDVSGSDTGSIDTSTLGGGSSNLDITNLLGGFGTDQSGLPNGLPDIVPPDVTSGSGFSFPGSDTSGAEPTLGSDITFIGNGSSTNIDNGASSDAGNGLGSFAGDASNIDIGGLDGSLDVNSAGGAFGDLFDSGGSSGFDIGNLFDFAEGGLVTPQGNHNLIKQKMAMQASGHDEKEPSAGGRTHYATGGPVNVGLRATASPNDGRQSAVTNDPIVNAIQRSAPSSSISSSTSTPNIPLSNQNTGADLSGAISAQTNPPPVTSPAITATAPGGGISATPRISLPTVIPTRTATPKRRLDGTTVDSNGTTGEGGTSGVGVGVATGETGPVSASEAVGLGLGLAGLATGPIGSIAASAVSHALGVTNPLSPVNAIVALVNAIAQSQTQDEAPIGPVAPPSNPFAVDDNVNDTPISDAIASISASDTADDGTGPSGDDGASSDAANGNAPVGDSASVGSNSSSSEGPGVGDSGASSDAGNGNASGNDGSASSASSDGTGDSASSDGSAGGSSDGGSSGGDGGSSGGDGGGGGGDFSTGGKIRGKGTTTSDSIQAHVSQGEYILNAEAVKAVGIPFLDKINSMFRPSPAKLQQGKAVNRAQQGRGR